MAREANDEINSFDAMLSFLTWRGALLKYREEGEAVLKNQQGSGVPNFVEEESKKVLAEMKLLYPHQFAENGDSSFLEDFFLQDSLSQEKKDENNEKVRIISNEIKRKIEIIKRLNEIKDDKYYEASVYLGQFFFDENLKNKIRANKNLSEFQDLDKKLNSNDVLTLQSPYGFDVSQNNHKSFHEPVFLNPLNALYYTGLSALQAGIVSITNLCLPQQQKASPKVDIIKASIEKLEKMPNSYGTQVYV
jgi:hypothetical protein